MQEEPKFMESPELGDCESGRQPWKEHGPVALKSVSMDDIDGSDTTFQFRFKPDWKRLKESLKKHGQLKPISLVAGDGAFRIVDGFTRHLCIENLGWPKIKATIYPGMTEREAKALSYEANVMRRNLSCAEKANAMRDAINDGFSRRDVAKMFGVASRTVDRHLELPEELYCHIDCKAVTMAHGRMLKPLVGVVSSEVIGELVAWVKETGASEKALKAKLKKEGLIDRRGKRKAFGVIANGTVHAYRFKIGPQSNRHDRKEVLAFLRSAIEEIEGMIDGGSCAD